MFSQKDLDQIHSKGIEIGEIEDQINNFTRGFPFIDLDAPATIEAGMHKFNSEDVLNWITFYEQNSPKNEVIKFVPASGAASRMFKKLFEFADLNKGQVGLDDELPEDIKQFIDNINKFAFYYDLKAVINEHGDNLGELINNMEYARIINYLLQKQGLNYALLPKGLLKFHHYEDSNRTPVEEHLVEGANYCKNNNDEVKIHFTVSPEHMEGFKLKVEAVKARYENNLSANFDISYSIQKPSTDTIAVDLENNPFRNIDGSILFRPGGHGALIENLNDLDADLIFIKNIDNIVPDHLREETYHFKKALGGYLLYLQKKIFHYLRMMNTEVIIDQDIDEIITFIEDELKFEIRSRTQEMKSHDALEFLYNQLNKPIRICGMVKNEGEPGGGPFWVENSKGEISLQIVESSQIDLSDTEQEEIFSGSTHFNPVDLVCGVKDFEGKKFELKQYIDQSTGFISIKSKDGLEIKALELPGLWNGAMAGWITVFVEVPIITFNPVKTVNDLLRNEHQ